MAAQGLTCAVCGTEAPTTSRFCGECGRPLPEKAPEPSPPEPVEERVAAHTLLSVPSPLAEPEPAREEGTETMVGVYAPSFPGFQEAARDVIAADRPEAPAPAREPAPPPREAARAPAAGRERESAPSEPSRPPAPDAGQVEASSAAPPRRAPSSDAATRPDDPSASGLDRAELHSGSESFGGSSSTFGTGRSMRRRRERSSRGRAATGPRKLAWIAGASIAGFVLVALAIVGSRGGFGGERVRASLERGPGAEHLVVEVPGAPAGARVRFDGELATLEGGRATFALEPSDVRLGENVVQIGVVTPGGETEEHQLSFEVPYRLRVDPAGFAKDPPVLRLLVEAPPGAIVLLDDHVVSLDEEGRGKRELPLDGEASGGELEREIRHALRTPQGEEDVGSTTFVVPMAKLLVERPGNSITTEDASVELALAVHPEAKVTLDGEPVENRAGRVRERLEVPSVGTHVFTLRATEPEIAPSTRKVEVRRVRSLAAEVERFVPDGGFDYATLAADPKAARGRKVKLDGLAYHVETKDGKSDLQILARNCPRGGRCPVWVSYPGVVGVRPHSWVRVAGEISGEQRFKTVDTGRVVSVPRVDAAFVVPLSN